MIKRTICFLAAVKRTTVFLTLSFVLLLSYSCHQEDNDLVHNGTASFSIQEVDKNDWRINDIEPAFVLISIECDRCDSKEDLLLSLFSFGEQYISENLKLRTGDYRITRFVVLDRSKKAIYATPVEGTELAHYVDDPLPIEFTVKNGVTMITPQVLAIEEQGPEEFGYSSFGFDVVSRHIDLPVRLLLTNGSEYSPDSVIIKLSNSTGNERKQRLLVSKNDASGVLRNIQPGMWKMSIEYYKKLNNTDEPADHSLGELKKGTVTVTVTPKTTGLHSDGTVAFITDGSPEIRNTISWEHYYLGYMFTNESLSAVVTLPADPLNPFFGVSIQNPKWLNFYVDRYFFYTTDLPIVAVFSEDNTTNSTINYMDTTSFAAEVRKAKGTSWFHVDCWVVINYENSSQSFYYFWKIENYAVMDSKSDEYTGRVTLGSKSTKPGLIFSQQRKNKEAAQITLEAASLGDR